MLSAAAIDAMHVDTTGGMVDRRSGAGYGLGWVRLYLSLGYYTSTKSCLGLGLGLACLCLPWLAFACLGLWLGLGLGLGLALPLLALACLGLACLALPCLALECRVQRFSSLDRVQSKALRRNVSSKKDRGVDFPSPLIEPLPPVHEGTEKHER